MQEIAEALALLKIYLKEFPEHDQGDIRVFEAMELLEKWILRQRH